MELKALGEERSRLSYELEFSLIGKWGTLGYPIIKHKAGELSKTFADNLRRELADFESLVRFELPTALAIKATL